ncbi:retrovirus-related pol polyprotein from transposon TNT 1-94 [Tanacetum coccineum]
MTTPITTTTPNSQMHNDIMTAGSRDRPPMLATRIYAQWQSCFMRYLATVDSPAVPEQTVPETFANMSAKNHAHYDAEAEAIHLILTGIGDDIYLTVDACNTARDIWVAVERLQQGESLNKQDVKTNLFWEFGKFTSRDGESIESYYLRFYKMMNEMVRNQLEIATMQIARNAHPLALVAATQQYPDTYYQAPKSHKSYAPTSKQSSSKRSHTTTRNKGKEIAKTITPPFELASEEESDPEQDQRDKDTQKNLALIAKQFRIQRIVTVAGAEETVGSQTDWLDDTDEELDGQELEAHYMYMVKIQEVSTADSGPSFDAKPLEKVQSNDDYNVFANETQHSEQPKSINDTYVVEMVDSNIIPNSLDMCDNEGKADQNAEECDDERAMLANLIAKLKLDTDENKKIQKQLKEANTSLTQELKECKSILDESNRTRDRYLVALHKKKLSFRSTKDTMIIPYDKDDLANIFAPYREETFDLEQESRSKLNKDKVKPYEYTKQNILYEIFKPPTREYLDQLYYANETQKKIFEAQLQDKNIAISELNKLIENLKGKYVDTKFDKPSIAQQPNALRIPKPSVLGKSTTFSNSLERKDFSKTKSVTKTNVSESLSKPVTTQILPKTATQAVRNTNVIKPGMYRIDIRTTQTRSPQLPQTSRNSNPCMSTPTRVIHRTSVSIPQLRSTQMKDKGNDLLTGSRGSDLYTISHQETSLPTPIYFLAKASPTQEWLWHQRLSYLNFDTINLLSKKDTLNGLPNLKYVKDQLCSSCEMSKAKRSIFKRYTKHMMGNLKLLSKASPTQAWLWHQRLSHLNFDTINLLFKKDIVNGLPKLKYVKDQLCSSCELGKAKQSTFKTKIVLSSKGWLNLLHMDLCGLMRIESIKGKKYILVIVDDYSRYTWTHFLRTKDETPEVLKDFLKMIKQNLQAQIITVRTNRGTKFLNKTLHSYFKEEGIEHQTSTPRTPEHNGVVERQNRTLVEAARMMISASKLPLFFWAEAIATTYYTQNRSLIIPYTKRNHITSLMTENLLSNTFASLVALGYRVYNKRTKLIVESIHINFDEIKEFLKVSDYDNSGLVPQLQKTYVHNSTELGTNDHNNEPSSSKLVPNVSPPAEIQIRHNKNGFVDPDHPEKFYRLRKALYGLKQALRACRPDIVQAVCYCERYQARPTENHLKEVKMIFWYLKETTNMGLWYSKDSSFELTDFLDTNHAAEAEYMTLSSAIATSRNPVQHFDTKYINVRYHFIKEQVERGIIELYFVRTEYQLADMFTKALPQDRFEYLVRRIGMRCLTPAKLEVLANESA